MVSRRSRDKNGSRQLRGKIRGRSPRTCELPRGTHCAAATQQDHGGGGTPGASVPAPPLPPWKICGELLLRPRKKEKSGNRPRPRRTTVARMMICELLEV
ncbi:hypothetical protein MRX96_029247 [Rhipicephalus microplus]